MWGRATLGKRPVIELAALATEPGQKHTHTHTEIPGYAASQLAYFQIKYSFEYFVLCPN